MSHHPNQEQPFRFDGFPCLIIDHGKISDRIVLLPQYLRLQPALETAQEEARKLNTTVYLLHSEGIFKSAFGKKAETSEAPCEKASYTLGHLECEKTPTPTDEMQYRCRYFIAWHSYFKGFEPHAATSLVHEEANEVTRFLRLARQVSDRNCLLAIPEDSSDFLRRLSWYSTLGQAWAGGWLKKSWRAWMADVATEAGLFPKVIQKEISRIHGRESAIPGSTTEHFGQAFGREIPHLFSELNHSVLDHASREVFIRFHVA